MELRTLYYFSVVAEELNITKAAERLNMTQPPLSSQIKQLEQELGVTLFDRGNRSLQLTQEGSALWKRARQILELSEKTKAEIENMGRGMTGSISISMVEGRAPYLAARWIAGFCEEYPGVTYSLWNGSSDDVIERLRQGVADMAIVAAPYDAEHLHGIAVGTEPWVAMISKENPLASTPGDELPLSALVGQRLIVPSRPSRIEAIHRWFQEIHAEPTVLCEMSNYLDAVALAEQDVGICIFPQTTYTPNPLIVSKVITQSAKQVKYILVWNKGRSLSEAAKEFVNYVRDCMEEFPGNSSVGKYL